MTTFVNIILDESGSMGSVESDVISGYNEYIKKLKKAKDTRVTLTKFNTVVDIVYSDLKVKEVENLDRTSYSPNGFTALYDAIGQTVKKIEDKLKKDDKALVVIFTDGMDNVSKEYTKADIVRIIDTKQLSGKWTFVYLGADQNAWLVSESLGITKGNTVSFDKANIKTVMNRTADISVSYSTSRGGGYQENLMGEDN